MCPDLVVVVGEQLDKYRAASQQIFQSTRSSSTAIADTAAALRRELPPTVPIQRMGMDEFFLDVTKLVDQKGACDPTPGHLPGWALSKEQEAEDAAIGAECVVHECNCHVRLWHGANIASELRAMIKTELGYECCGGVGHNKLLAKVAGERHKPNQQTTVLPSGIDALLSRVKLRRIPGLGHATRKSLHEHGITTVNDNMSGVVSDPNYQVEQAKDVEQPRLTVLLGAKVAAALFFSFETNNLH